jgi:hypothetical protein
MKSLTRFFVLELIVVLTATTLFGQKHPTEADFPNQYVVLNTSTSSGIAAICTMAIRDLAIPNVGLIVQQVHQYFGGCHTWDAGAVLHGRRNKGDISLLVKDEHGKPKVEKWRISGTVSLPAPNAQPQTK